jgi:hypothetical protein
MNGKYKNVVGQIQKLSDDQHRLYALASKRELTDAEKRKLAGIKAELQELWLSRKQERTHMKDPVDDFVEQWYRKAA